MRDCSREFVLLTWCQRRIQHHSGISQLLMSEHSSQQASTEKPNHKPVGFVRSHGSHKTGHTIIVRNKDGSIRGLRRSRNGTSSGMGTGPSTKSPGSYSSSGETGKEEEEVDVEEVGSENSSPDHEGEGEGDTQTEEDKENTVQSVRFTEDTDFTTKSTYTRNKKGGRRRGGSSRSMKTLNYLSGYSRR
ncbi:hypothetical protein L486_01962 [Kwoniella mangroviensis CBS 10435]|uniref:Uncharacterized protein n=1 Tax=Kwoniella mangroviensis CBS 10435 TaxID=1331196 RepID=A0A1B9J3Q1_9TREE|nr:hypothetical protein L486_01962 [Kwoniella mangroviensis CBS 10435]